MNDIEDYVYTKVRNAVKTAYPNCDVSADSELVPEKFPRVAVTQISDSTALNHMSNTDREFASMVTFDVNIQTNSDTKKSDAKAIKAVVDSAFDGLGFRRVLALPTPSVNRTIFRITMRYDALVSKSPNGEQGKYVITAR